MESFPPEIRANTFMDYYILFPTFYGRNSMIKYHAISIQFLMESSGDYKPIQQDHNFSQNSTDLQKLQIQMYNITQQSTQFQKQSKQKQIALEQKINKLLKEKQENASKDLLGKKSRVHDDSISVLFDQNNAEKCRLMQQNLKMKKTLYEYKQSLGENKIRGQRIEELKGNLLKAEKELKEMKLKKEGLEGEKSKVENENSQLLNQKLRLKEELEEKNLIIEQFTRNNEHRVAQQSKMKQTIIYSFRKSNDDLKQYLYQKHNINANALPLDQDQHTIIDFSSTLLHHLESYHKYTCCISDLLAHIKTNPNACFENPRSFQKLEQMKIQSFNSKNRQGQINPVTCTNAHKTAEETLELLTTLFQRVKTLDETERILEERQSEASDLKEEINNISSKMDDFRKNHDIVEVDNRKISSDLVVIFRNLNDGIYHFKKEIQSKQEKVRDLEASIKQKLRQIVQLKNQKEIQVEKLKKEIERIKREASEERNMLVRQNTEQVKNLKEEHEEKRRAQSKEHEKKIGQLKVSHQSQISDIQAYCLDKQNQLTLKKKQSELHQSNIKTMKQTITTLQIKLKDTQKDLAIQTDKYKKLDLQKQQFLARLKSIIQEALPQTSEILDISFDADGFGLEQFSQQLLANANIPKYLVESELFNSFDKGMKKYFDKEITELMHRKISGSKTIVICDAAARASSWIKLCFGRPNILMLLKMSNGICIAGFSEEPMSDHIRKQGVGCILSLTKKKKYKLKPRPDASILKYSPYYFSFGNDEILIKGEGVLTSLFGTSQNYFDTMGENAKDIFGEYESRDMKFNEVQFHELFFE